MLSTFIWFPNEFWSFLHPSLNISHECCYGRLKVYLRLLQKQLKRLCSGQPGALAWWRRGFPSGCIRHRGYMRAMTKVTLICGTLRSGGPSEEKTCTSAPAIKGKEWCLTCNRHQMHGCRSCKRSRSFGESVLSWVSNQHVRCVWWKCDYEYLLVWRTSSKTSRATCLQGDISSDICIEIQNVCSM